MQYLHLPRMVLLDLDGTLADTAPDLAWAVDCTMRQLERTPCGEERVRAWIGDGIDGLIRQALAVHADGAASPGLYRQALRLFTEIYQTNQFLHSHCYPGVAEGLAWLQQQRFILGCVTNKRCRFTRRLLQKLCLQDFFAVIISGDTLKHKKPHPAPLLHAVQSQGVAAADALMIGDTEVDVQAARAAGLPVLCVDYGYTQGRDIRQARPDAVIDSLARLPELFQHPAELPQAAQP